MKKKLFLIAALAVAAAVAAWYVLRMDQGDGMAYLTEPVTIGNITRTVNATGEVGAVQLVSVGAQVGGQIKKLHVVLGQDVKKGDLIAEIDSVPQLNQLETDKARLQSYESQLAAKKVALKIAKTKYDREMQLKKRDAASKESLEDAENAYALAKAEVTELESQIRQARIAVNTDEVNLGYTRITAPLDGTIVSVPVDEGQTVNANQTTPTIVQIADLDKMEIRDRNLRGRHYGGQAGYAHHLYHPFQSRDGIQGHPDVHRPRPDHAHGRQLTRPPGRSAAAVPPRRPLRHRTMPCTITAKRLSTTRKARCASA